MKEKILLVILFATFGLWARGQSLSPVVIAAAGGENFTSTLSLEWTLGELAVDYFSTTKGMLTEGFHQPKMEFFELPNNLLSQGIWTDTPSKQSVHSHHLSSGFKIDVWPNPVHSTLKVQIESETNEAISIELIDVMGRKVISKTSHTPFGFIELDMTQYTPGMYLIKFFKQDGTLIKTILNTKH